MGFRARRLYDERVSATRPSPPPDFLGTGDPPPFRVVCEAGRSPFVLICDHASCLVPRALRSLGLEPATLQTHIGWDIGAAEVARLLANSLDAVLILQSYSRLVIDCNRPLNSPASIAPISDTIPIPANAAVSREEAQQRAAAIFTPYHERIRLELDRRGAVQRAAVLVSIHSFTPVFQGFVRPWHVGTLYNRDPRLAQALMHELATDPALVVGDNEPYAASDATDFAIPQHGELRQLLHVGIEVRQDLISEETGQQQWARRLALALNRSLQSLAASLHSAPGSGPPASMPR
jgi:predicted N-formylglutamate amidohydrolase